MSCASNVRAEMSAWGKITAVFESFVRDQYVCQINSYEGGRASTCSHIFRIGLEPGLPYICGLYNARSRMPYRGNALRCPTARSCALSVWSLTHLCCDRTRAFVYHGALILCRCCSPVRCICFKMVCGFSSQEMVHGSNLRLGWRRGR